MPISVSLSPWNVISSLPQQGPFRIDPRIPSSVFGPAMEADPNMVQTILHYVEQRQKSCSNAAVGVIPVNLVFWHLLQCVYQVVDVTGVGFRWLRYVEDCALELQHAHFGEEADHLAQLETVALWRGVVPKAALSISGGIEAQKVGLE